MLCVVFLHNLINGLSLSRHINSLIPLILKTYIPKFFTGFLNYSIRLFTRIFPRVSSRNKQNLEWTSVKKEIFFTLGLTRLSRCQFPGIPLLVCQRQRRQHHPRIPWCWYAVIHNSGPRSIHGKHRIWAFDQKGSFEEPFWYLSLK